MFTSQFCHRPASPWMNSSGGPSPARCRSTCGSPPTSTLTVLRQRGPVDAPSRRSRRRPRTGPGRPATAWAADGHSSPRYRGRARRSSRASARVRVLIRLVPKSAEHDRSSRARATPTTCATTCPASSRSGRSPTGAARSASRALFDRTLYEFLYRYWFRVEVEGIENVPADGRRAARLQPLGRAAAGRADDRQGDQGGAPAPAPGAPDRRALLQGLSALLRCSCPRSAASPRTRPTCTGCCTTRTQLVLVFPEGRKGTEKLYKDRYRLRRFGRGGFVEAAMRARAPIVPDRAWSAPRRRRRSSPTSPCCSGSPASSTSRSRRRSRTSGIPGMLGYLPAKFRIRFLEPIPTDAVGREPWKDRALVQTVAEEIRARIQEELYEMLAQRRSRLVRMTLRAGPRHRPVDLLGRPARAGARARPSDRGDRRRRHRRPDGRARAHRVRARRHTSTRCCGGSCRRPRSTRWSTRGWSVDSTDRAARVAHENNVIGTMNILAACGGPDSPVRKFVFKSSAHYYGCEQDDPAFFTEEMRRPHPPRTPIERDIVEAEEAVARLRRAQPGRHRHRAALRQRPRARRRHVAHARCSRCPSCPTILGFDPRYQFVHEDDIVGALEHAVRNDLPGRLQRAPATACSCSRRSSSLLGKPLRAGPAAVGHGARGRAAAPARAPHPAGDAQPAALRPRRSTTASSRPPASATATRRARPCSSFAEHLRLRAARCAAAREPYRYEREVEEFLRWSPASAARVRQRRASYSLQRRVRRSAARRPYHRCRLDAARARARPSPSLIASSSLLGVVGRARYAYDHAQRGHDRPGRDGRRRRRRRVERRRRPRGGCGAALLGPLQRPVRVVYHGRRFTLTARAAAVGVDIQGSVERALARSRDGNAFSRTWREPARRVRCDADIQAAVT